VPAVSFTPLSELGLGVVCSEALACTDTGLFCSDLSLIYIALTESGAAVACSETRACSDTLQTCSDLGVGITPLIEA